MLAETSKETQKETARKRQKKSSASLCSLIFLPLVDVALQVIQLCCWDCTKRRFRALHTSEKVRIGIGYEAIRSKRGGKLPSL